MENNTIEISAVCVGSGLKTWEGRQYVSNDFLVEGENGNVEWLTCGNPYGNTTPLSSDSINTAKQLLEGKVVKGKLVMERYISRSKFAFRLVSFTV